MAARNVGKSVGEKLTKSEKRVLRKQARKLYTLQKHDSELANISTEPTVHLLVGNGGLMCGINRTQLTRVFGRFGSIERVVMVPQRSYSFVTFKTIEDAIKAMKCINGSRFESAKELFKGDTTLYLSYLTHTPNDVTVGGCVLPPGLKIFEDFINEQEEQELLDVLWWKNTEKPLSEDAVQQQLRHRRVQHFGYEFLYGSNNVHKTKPLAGGIPSVCDAILDRMLSCGSIKHRPDQLTINEYQPGQGIPPHIDTHSAFEDNIGSISLGAKITMDFRHSDGRHVSVLLPRRSLLIMSGESRYQWTHGITPRRFDIVRSGLETTENTVGQPDAVSRSPSAAYNADDVTKSGVTQYERETRISLTFRKILHEPCTCIYSAQCDSQGYEEASSDSNTSSVPTTQDEAKALEKTHVHSVYEKIAEHFSDTRHSPWPMIAEFLRRLPPGSLVADVGCGNGKYLGINSSIFKTGSDRSFNLAAIAKDRGHPIIVCDILALPYRSCAFDVCLCIAVLHHLSTNERRQAGLRELVRVIRPGGLVLVYVWALEQKLERFQKDALREVTYGEQAEETAANSTEQTDPKDKLEVERKSVEANYSEEGDLQKVQINASRETFEQQDLFVPWKYRGTNKNKNPKTTNSRTQCNCNEDHECQKAEESHVFHRFYHVFKEGELLELCRCVDNVFVKELYYDRGNWCVLLEKKDE